MSIKKEVKHLSDLAKVLRVLASEASEAGCFNNEAQELLKKIGSRILFMGVSIGYTQPEVKTDIIRTHTYGHDGERLGLEVKK